MLQALLNGIAERLEGQSGETLVGDDVASRRGRPHLTRHLGDRAVAGVAELGEHLTDDLLVEALGLLAVGQPRLVRLADPPAGGVGRVHLVDEDQLAGVGETELVLRVGEDQPGGGADLGTAGEQRECGRHHLLPEIGVEQVASHDLVTRERFVVAALLRLGGGRDDRLGERTVLAEAVGELVAVHLAGAVLVHPPQRGVGHAGDVPADDDLDGQRCGRDGHGRVGVGHRDEMVRDQVGGLFEPPRRQLVEHLPLVGHAGEDAIERREAVGGDDQAALVAERPRGADLAVPTVGERQVGLHEGFEQADPHRYIITLGRRRSPATRAGAAGPSASSHRRRCVDTVAEQFQAEVLVAAPSPMVRVLPADHEVLGVRHETEHVAGLVAHAGDVAHRAVRIRAPIPQRHLTRLRQRVGIGMDVATLSVRDRAVDRRLDPGGPEAARCRLGAEHDPAALEATVGVVAERTREQLGASQDLEPVADTDDGASGGDELAQTLADADVEIECEHAARAERVAVRESTGDREELGVVEQSRILGEFGREHDRGVGAGQLEGEREVGVAVGAGTGDDEGVRRAHASSLRPDPGETGDSVRRRAGDICLHCRRCAQQVDAELGRSIAFVSAGTG